MRNHTSPPAESCGDYARPAAHAAAALRRRAHRFGGRQKVQGQEVGQELRQEANEELLQRGGSVSKAKEQR